MSEPARTTAPDDSPTPEVVADLLELLAEHNVDHGLGDIEQLVARLRANAQAAAAAREVLCSAPAEVLRQGVRLRAARIEPAR
jgi:hypothetical protein